MLVGRDPETGTIARLAAGARLGEAGVLVLLGEPVVGKTAVLGHAVSQLIEGFRVLRATGRHFCTGLRARAYTKELRLAIFNRP